MIRVICYYGAMALVLVWGATACVILTDGVRSEAWWEFATGLTLLAVLVRLLLL